MYLYETHMHTSTVSACAYSTPAEQVWAYKKRGYAGIIVTDHFINGNAHWVGNVSWKRKMEFVYSGFLAALDEGVKCGLDVYFGWEFSINGTDLLTYGLDLDFLLEYSMLHKMSAEGYSRLIRESGGFLAQAHPFRKGFWIDREFPLEPGLLDAVEVFNAAMPDHVNRQAHKFASKHNLPMLSGSDSHGIDLHFASGIALREKAKNIHDIIEAIKSGGSELILPGKKYFN